jgi:hypothetical protein
MRVHVSPDALSCEPDIPGSLAALSCRLAPVCNHEGTPLKDGGKRKFHSFDIAGLLMPAVLPPDITFSIHDIL